MGAILQFERVHKRYGDVAALAGVSLTIQGGEFFTLLGPSGCGKTTLLRCVAGFLRSDDGRILCDGDRLDRLPAHKRDIGMVFQNYAIFPHLTVFENVAYGLRARRVDPAEIRRRALETLTLVQMDALADRRPDQLSGGQQQRVALARAMAIRPRLLLMDEPLSNLDAKLRVEMRTEIRRLQRELGITTVYVTHDQEEALAISERLAVMNAGRVEQVGFPWDVYQAPQSAFVAQFIGTSNTLAGTLGRGDGEWASVLIGDWTLRARRADGVTGSVLAVFRPEALSLLADGREAAGATIGDAVVVSREFLGAVLRYRLRLDGGALIHLDVHKPNAAHLTPEGARIRFSVRPEDVMLFPAKEGS
jgi:iron(III) transport system ATP-binding protein